MRIRLCFKTPDVMQQVEDEFETGEDGEMTWAEIKMRNFIERFVKYNKYIRVEFDSETETVKVLEQL